MNSREIPEIKDAEIDYRIKQNQTRKSLEKIKRLKQKFYFIDRIIQPKKNTNNRKEDIELEWAILHLFKSIGFKCVKPKTERDVDVKVKFRTTYLGIEVKNGNLVLS